MEIGTLIAEFFWHAFFEHDREVIQCWLPFGNRHCPLLGGLVDRHVDALEGGRFVGINLAIARELANHAIDRFDYVRCGNRFANRPRKIKQRDQVLPLRSPRLADRRVFLIPSLSEIFQSNDRARR